ncbi:recombinase RecT [Sporosarcina sp. Marseille-Q4063]|uniref:RecT family recombinase n=1 Tax=Sporosarcina sp. Marseille-Q4063 TaxID=2810514 RepID=UPI001BAE7C84|nr:RecT family recombinase [Sporosarcina sp. Marseille-Q4063]QUW23388.1 recombinase RecT [Sporosarcina sp. Marseille-Q4063]
MEKVLTFTNGQKSLIWNRFVQPANGTQEEANHFIEVCETFGLNPLLGDIVFQRYETRNGPNTSFITTRDGLLRVATTQEGYVGPPNANVVREGDTFEFIPSEGSVRHEFGQKRGSILGAYAVMHHKRFRPVAVFVDFQEYFQANSGELNSKYKNKNVWDKMPSAMIQKIAEVFVLRRQFPLGGLYTREEMSIDEGFNDNSGNADIPNQSNPAPQKQSEVAVNEQPPAESVQKPKENTIERVFVLQSFEKGISPQNVPFAKLNVMDKETNEVSLVLVKENEETIDSLSRVPVGQELSLVIKNKSGFNFLEKFSYVQTDGQNVQTEPESKQTKSVQEPVQQENQIASEPTGPLDAFIMEKYEPGTTPAGVSFAKMYVKNIADNKQSMVFAQGNEAVEKTKHLTKGSKFAMQTRTENGFTFFVKLKDADKRSA